MTDGMMKADVLSTEITTIAKRLMDQVAAAKTDEQLEKIGLRLVGIEALSEMTPDELALYQ